MTRPRTLYEKIVDAHTVRRHRRSRQSAAVRRPAGAERIHEPAGVLGAARERTAACGAPQGSLAVVDHVNPTTPVRTMAIADAAKARQVSYLGENCREFGIELFDVLDKRQGIEHVVATEQGFVLPGMVIAAGDSHTITHGGLGALGVRHRHLGDRASAGDADAAVPDAAPDAHHRRRRARLRRHGEGPDHGGDRAHRRQRRRGLRDRVRRRAIAAPERRRPADGLQHERGSRRARCVDRARRQGPRLPAGQAALARRARCGTQAVAHWATLRSDPDAAFDARGPHRRSRHRADGHLGHEPRSGADDRRQRCPIPRRSATRHARRDMERALGIHGASARARGWTRSRSIAPSSARAPTAASRTCATPRACCAGASVADGVRAMVVPGSTAVHDQAEAEGLAPRVPRRRIRMAAVGMLDVRGDERRSPAARRALRVVDQPQLRGTPGRGRAHASDEPGDGRRGGDRRPP